MRNINLIGLLLICFLSFKSYAEMKNVEMEQNYGFCERDCTMEYNFFKRYARQGSSLANLSMAIMNYKGHGRDINIPLANRLLISAARAGEPAAMYQVAYNLMYGLYMKQNLEKALIWFKRTEKLNVLDSKRNITLIKRFLNEKETVKRSSMKTVFTKMRHAKEDVFLSQEDDDDIEHHSVTQQFYWNFILYNAKLQT